MNLSVAIVACTILAEAEGQPPEAVRGVADVIYNRAGGLPHRLPAVCKQPRHFEGYSSRRCQRWLREIRRTGREPTSPTWDQARGLAVLMASGAYQPASKANHFHDTTVRPYWAKSGRLVLAAGKLRFYHL